MKLHEITRVYSNSPILGQSLACVLSQMFSCFGRNLMEMEGHNLQTYHLLLGRMPYMGTTPQNAMCPPAQIQRERERRTGMVPFMPISICHAANSQHKSQLKSMERIYIYTYLRNFMQNHTNVTTSTIAQRLERPFGAAFALPVALGSRLVEMPCIWAMMVRQFRSVILRRSTSASSSRFYSVLNILQIHSILFMCACYYGCMYNICTIFFWGYKSNVSVMIYGIFWR